MLGDLLLVFAGLPAGSSFQIRAQANRDVSEAGRPYGLPSRGELLGENIVELMDKMSESYAERLRIEPAAIRDSHRAMVEAIFEGRS